MSLFRCPWVLLVASGPAHLGQSLGPIIAPGLALVLADDRAAPIAVLGGATGSLSRAPRRGAQREYPNAESLLATQLALTAADRRHTARIASTPGVSGWPGCQGRW
jgi:hypothetical protein